MTESERAAALKTQIMNALRAQEFTDLMFDGSEGWTTQVLDNTRGVLTGGQTPDGFAARLARNIVSIFGGRVFIGMFTEEQS